MTKKNDNSASFHNLTHLQSNSVQESLRLGSLGIVNLVPGWQNTEAVKMIKATTIVSSQLTLPKLVKDALKLSSLGSLGLGGLSSWQDTDTAKIIKATTRASSQLTLSKSVQEFLKSSTIGSLGMNDLFTDWQKSDTAKMIRASTRASSQLTLSKSVPEFLKSSSIRSLGMSDLFADWHNSDAAKMIREITKTQSEALSPFSQLCKLPSFEKLASLDNSPFFGLSVPIPQDIDEPVDLSFAELEKQIADDVSSTTDFNKLPDQTKKILGYLWVLIIFPIIINLISNYIYDQVKEARKELESISTPREVRLFTRSSHKTFDAKILKGNFRVTVANSLHFRKKPSVKSEIIETLPIGTVVEVLDTSNNRSWLLVSVDINGQLEQGWVFRRYTTYFK